MSDGHLNERQVRSIVVEEITKHVLPLQTGLASVTATLRSLYSNGSEGPPGYLEMLRKEDDERYGRLTEASREQAKDIKEIKEVILLQKDREERKSIFTKKALKIGWKVVAVILAGLGSLIGWGVHQTVPIVKILIDDYIKAHPMVMERMKHVSQNPGMNRIE